jgi:hypothetical protein
MPDKVRTLPILMASRTLELNLNYAEVSLFPAVGYGADCTNKPVGINAFRSPKTYAELIASQMR